MNDVYVSIVEERRSLALASNRDWIDTRWELLALYAVVYLWLNYARQELVN